MTGDLQEPRDGAALAVEGLRKRFGGVEVLTGIDVRLREGGITGFIGPNGAGKTTSRDCSRH